MTALPEHQMKEWRCGPLGPDLKCCINASSTLTLTWPCSVSSIYFLGKGLHSHSIAAVRLCRPPTVKIQRSERDPLCGTCSSSLPLSLRICSLLVQQVSAGACVRESERPIWLIYSLRSIQHPTCTSIAAWNGLFGSKQCSSSQKVLHRLCMGAPPMPLSNCKAGRPGIPAAHKQASQGAHAVYGRQPLKPRPPSERPSQGACFRCLKSGEWLPV